MYHARPGEYKLHALLQQVDDKTFDNDEKEKTHGLTLSLTTVSSTVAKLSRGGWNQQNKKTEHVTSAKSYKHCLCVTNLAN